MFESPKKNNTGSFCLKSFSNYRKNQGVFQKRVFVFFLFPPGRGQAPPPAAPRPPCWPAWPPWGIRTPWRALLPHFPLARPSLLLPVLPPGRNPSSATAAVHRHSSPSLTNRRPPRGTPRDPLPPPPLAPAGKVPARRIAPPTAASRHRVRARARRRPAFPRLAVLIIELLVSKGCSRTPPLSSCRPRSPSPSCFTSGRRQAWSPAMLR